jgi:hypothetical protein
MSVLLLGILGLAIILASVARMIVLEHQVRGPVVLFDPGPQEPARVAA